MKSRKEREKMTEIEKRKLGNKKKEKNLKRCYRIKNYNNEKQRVSLSLSLSLSLFQVIYLERLVGFYGISTIVGYLMPNPLHTYILNI